MSNKITVKEFKDWLGGVLDFQDENWIPNKEQWEKILNKINQLEVNATYNFTKEYDDHSENYKPDFSLYPEIKDVSSQTGSIENKTNKRESGIVKNIDLETSVKLPESALVKNTQVKVVQSSVPEIIKTEDGGRIINTGKTHKMDNDLSGKEYKSSFI
jgi:hypothetical protein